MTILALFVPNKPEHRNLSAPQRAFIDFLCRQLEKLSDHEIEDFRRLCKQTMDYFIPSCIEEDWLFQRLKSVCRQLGRQPDFNAQIMSNPSARKAFEDLMLRDQVQASKKIDSQNIHSIKREQSL